MGFRAVLTTMQKPMRNLQCHAKALFAPGGAMGIGIVPLLSNSPVDSGAVMTS